MQQWWEDATTGWNCKEGICIYVPATMRVRVSAWGWSSIDLNHFIVL
jgi:hypothetical protein